MGDQKLWGLHRHGVTLGAPSVMGTLKRGLSWCHPCSCPDSRHHAVHVKTLAVTWNFFSLKKKKQPNGFVLSVVQSSWAMQMY